MKLPKVKSLQSIMRIKEDMVIAVSLQNCISVKYI